MIVVTRDGVKIQGMGPAVSVILELKSDAACQIKCISCGLTNTFFWGMCPDRQKIAVPIPRAARDLRLEMIPDLKSAVSSTKDGFVIVTKHTLLFTFAGLNDAGVPQYDFQEHILTANGHDYHIDVRERCPFIRKDPTSLCFICGLEQATDNVAQCGHSLICATCKNDREAVFSSCPFCPFS
jgi:hypothetical protein